MQHNATQDLTEIFYGLDVVLLSECHTFYVYVEFIMFFLNLDYDLREGVIKSGNPFRAQPFDVFPPRTSQVTFNRIQS